ncbi:hypothetical protein ACIQBJ_31880 [Kitasatospora sp. NPDC088391]|uniref:hypothetical protein n=1 Tax=Kitasatospora sp. NPDC088391 TaxID=3364074 RepID=UPI00382F6C7E
MSDHTVTEERVREKAAELRKHVERWKGIEGFEGPAADLDVEALARGVLEVRARPRLSGPELLEAVRPQWERKAAQLGLEGEAREAFVLDRLDEDVPQVYCETQDFFVVVYYVIHLNRAAAEMVDVQTETVLQALEVASLGLPEIDEIISPLEALIRAEAMTIKAVSDSQDNGQVQLVGVYPVPVFIAEPDDLLWDEVHAVPGHQN